MTPQYQGLAFFGILFLLIYSGLWVAVAFLGQTGRTGSWWTTVIGLLMTGLGIVVYGFATYQMTEQFRSGRYSVGTWTYYMLGGGVGVYGGLITFTLGLILIALRMVRVVRRAQELEQLCASMAAEINSRGQNAPPRI